MNRKLIKRTGTDGFRKIESRVLIYTKLRFQNSIFDLVPGAYQEIQGGLEGWKF